jgi:hypothetical protein
MTMSYDASDDYGMGLPADDGLIPDKTIVRAKGVTADLGYTSKGREQVAVQFAIVDGEYAGRNFTWYGYFGDDLNGSAKNTPTEITIKALRACGWAGDDITNLEGIDREEVELVIAIEPDLEGTPRNRVKWVNKPGGGLALKERMDDKQRAAFKARMASKVKAVNAKLGAADPPKPNARPNKKRDDDEIPF